jgi:hypothetical protein
MKVYGAHVYCSAPGCHAEPYPDHSSGHRESFDLLCITGEWRCELHRPARKEHTPRAVGVTPLAALSTFEDLLKTEGARLEEAVVEDCAGLLADFKAYSDEVEHGLAELRMALTPQKPPASPDDAPKSRSTPKKIRKVERLAPGQQDWVIETALPAEET